MKKNIYQIEGFFNRGLGFYLVNIPPFLLELVIMRPEYLTAKPLVKRQYEIIVRRSQTCSLMPALGSKV
mgnify:CR=1 FL=1